MLYCNFAVNSERSRLFILFVAIVIAKILLQLVLQTSEKQRLYGIRKQVNLFTMQLYGSVEELLISVKKSKKTQSLHNIFRTTQVLWLTLISLQQKLNGFSTMLRVQEN